MLLAIPISFCSIFLGWPFSLWFVTLLFGLGFALFGLLFFGVGSVIYAWSVNRKRVSQEKSELPNHANTGGE
jgi:hypothetical protein